MMLKRATSIPHSEDRATLTTGEAVRGVASADRGAPAPIDGDSKYLGNLSVSGASAKKFAHGLGRVPRGVMICTPTTVAGAGVWISAQDSSSVTVSNPAAGTATFGILVF